MNREYYYLDSNEQKGPLHIDQLKSVGLKPDTFVWSEGFDDWKPAKEVEELKIMFIKIPPPSPTSKKMSYARITGGLVVVFFLSILFFSFLSEYERLFVIIIFYLIVAFFATLPFVFLRIKKSELNWIFGSIFVISFLATLLFHVLPEHFMVFPKSNLTFSNTFIFNKDIDKLIERYNDASFIEKQAIRQEPLMRKLFEKEIIHE